MFYLPPKKMIWFHESSDPKRAKQVKALLRHSTHDVEYRTIRFGESKSNYFSPNETIDVYLGDNSSTLSAMGLATICRCEKTTWGLFATEAYRIYIPNKNPDAPQFKIIIRDLINNLDGRNKRAIEDKLKLYYNLPALDRMARVSIIVLRF